MTKEERARFATLSDEEMGTVYFSTAERVTKWRSVFAGWQLGTRLADDPESKAVRNTAEVLILLRAEVNAIMQLLQEAGVATAREFTEQVTLELEHLDKGYEGRFPGFSARSDGISMKIPEAVETMARMNFKP